MLAGVKGKFFYCFGACHFQPMILTVSKGKIYFPFAPNTPILLEYNVPLCFRFFIISLANDAVLTYPKIDILNSNFS